MRKHRRPSLENFTTWFYFRSVNHRLLTATLIVSTKSITAYSGDVNYLTQHSKDKIGASCGSFDCTKLSSRSKSMDENTVVGQLIDMGDHMSVVVYPNPSNDVFIIELESEVLTSVSQVVITDMAGRVIETASMNPNIAIEVGRELIPGIYNIQVRNGGLVSSSRLIKK